MLALLWEALEGLVSLLRGDTKNLINSGSKLNPLANRSFRIQLPRFDTNPASTRKFNKYVGIFDNLDPQPGVAEISLAILSIRMRKTLPGHAPAIAQLALVRTSAKVAETKNLGTLLFEIGVPENWRAENTTTRTEVISVLLRLGKDHSKRIVWWKLLIGPILRSFHPAMKHTDHACQRGQ